MNVHAALDRFMRADDFLEGKRVVEELQGTLLSQEGLAYLKKQLENVEPDTPLAQVLGMKAINRRADVTTSVGGVCGFGDCPPAGVEQEIELEDVDARLCEGTELPLHDILMHFL